MRTLPLSDLSALLLGCTWLALSVAKLQEPSPSAAPLESLFGATAARTVGAVLVILEGLLGALLVLTWGRLRRYSLLLGALLLIAYGVWALAQPPIRCTCAGRLLALSPVAHTTLVGGMLVLTGLSLPATRLPLYSRVTIQRLSLLGLTTLVALFLGGRGGRTPAATQTQVVRTEVTMAHEPPRLRGSPPTESSAFPEPSSLATQGEPPEHSIVGYVQDARGTPTSDTLVWVSRSDATHLPLDVPSVRTGPSGDFSLRASLSVNERSICYDAGKFGTGCELESRLDRTAEGALIVRLPDRGVVSGRVIDDSGQPVAEATVQMWGNLAADYFGQSARFAPLAAPDWASTSTSSTGQFLLTGAIGKRYRVVALKKGFASDSLQSEVQVESPSIEETTLVLRRVYYARVLALDDTSGAVIPHAQYSARFKAGKPWDHRLESTDLWPNKSVNVVAFFNEHGASLSLVRSGVEPDVPVKVRIRVAGYREATVSVVPSHNETTVHAVRLQRADATPITPIQFEARWPGGGGFSGNLALGIERPGSSMETRIVFHEGVANMPVPLPLGVWTAVLRQGDGSTAHWGMPMANPVTFEVEQGGRGTVRLELRGGGVWLRPRSEAGFWFRAFKATLASGDLGVSLETSAPGIPLDGEPSTGDGFVVWLDPGEVTVRILKEGYALSERRVTVSADGSVVEYAPVLVSR